MYIHYSILLLSAQRVHGYGTTRVVKYLDLYGGHAVISIGHSHPHYVKALTDQLEQDCFLLKQCSKSIAGKAGG